MDFYYSDPHFGHSKILYEYERDIRTWKNLKEMDEAMIDIFNSVVPSDAITTWVGDVSWHGPNFFKEKIIKNMNGTHVLVCGNHDQKPHTMIKYGFSFACCHLKTIIAGNTVNVSHFPYRDTMEITDRYYQRALPYEGKWLICGHSHSSYKENKEWRMINVSADAREFKPVSRDWLEQYIQKTEHKIRKDGIE